MYKFYEFFTPVLEVMKDRSTYNRVQVAELVADHLGLTPEARSELIESGRPVYADRAQWAMTYLKQARALSNPKRGQWEITDRGLDLLAGEKPVNLKTLEQFPEYLEFKQRSGTRKKSTNGGTPSDISGYTPMELIDIALKQLSDEVTGTLIEKLRDINPYQFEVVCKDVLVAMGYGGDDIAYVTKKSGDGGIDAVIKQDPLGINMIYVQAKRHQSAVREKDIRDFLGALAQKATQDGVFITTSSFTPDARRAAEVASNMNVILIDGDELARLMVQYKVGVEERKKYSIYNVDTEYFDE